MKTGKKRVIIKDCFVKNARVAKLADAPDLGSGGSSVGVRVPSRVPTARFSGKAGRVSGEGGAEGFFMSAEQIIELLHMTPLAMEGGFCSEEYGSEWRLPDGRRAGSTIYYLLRGGDRSRWHKLSHDEIWFFHDGCAALQEQILPDGSYCCLTIGRDLLHGERPQLLVPGGTWQTTRLIDSDPNAWGLFSTVVVPGFEYSDFVGATEEEIRALFPQLHFL